MPKSAEPGSGLATYKRLLGYLRSHWLSLSLSIVGFMLFAASQPAAAKALEVLVDAVGRKDADARYYVPLLLIGVFLMRGIGAFLSSYYMARVTTGIINQLRIEMFTKVMRLPVGFYDQYSGGQLISRIIFNTGMVTAAITDALTTLLREGLTVICLLAYAFYLNWKLSLIFLAVAPIIAVIVAGVGKRLRRISTKVQDSMAELTQVCGEAVNGNRLVKSFQGEEREVARFTAATGRNLRQQLKMVRIQALNSPLMQLITVVAMGLIVFLVLQPEFLAQMSTGQYVAYITAIALIPKPVRQLTNINAVIQRGIAAAINIFHIMDLPAEVNRGSVRVERVRGEIDVENLSFTYPGGDEPVLRDISFRARPGEVVALVGRSGSGKSTLASLMMRFYDHEQGHIRVDGVDIRDYDLYNYRDQVAMVSQSVKLFYDTIANNIAYGCNADRATPEAIRRAAEGAYALEFIEALPEGFDTELRENGVRLSGGQNQRVAIARALLKNAPILILDEATSALDTESERAIQQALESVMKERTTLVIAHRLSTIIGADQILVMDQGRIVERGTHAELLARNGHYARLYEQGFELN